MRIFVSWSGERSKAVAKVVNNWVQSVIQSARPWLSTENIENGSVWYNSISTQLSETTFGIICITQDNKTNPWILFESGALAKGLSDSRICTFLIDLQPADITPPLSMFHHTFPTEESLYALVETINNNMSEGRLAEDVLRRSFKRCWPEFEEDFNKALENTKPKTKAKQRSQDEILAEILDNTRSLIRDSHNPSKAMGLSLGPRMSGEIVYPSSYFHKAVEKVGLDHLNSSIKEKVRDRLNQGGDVKDMINDLVELGLPRTFAIRLINNLLGPDSQIPISLSDL